MGKSRNDEAAHRISTETSAGPPPTISAKDAWQAVQSGKARLFDVRRRPLFDQSPLLAAMAQWRDPVFAAEWGERTPKDKPVFVYCVHGHEVSQNAATALRQAGQDAAYIDGGFASWVELNCPTEVRSDKTKNATYVTRERPKIDRIAVPWLIARFVDPEAHFVYVPAADVLRIAADSGFIPFDVPHVELSHVGDLCSFDSCIAKFQIKDAALDRVALIVRGADTGQHAIAPEAAGLLAISLGLADIYADDQAMLRRGMDIYDCLYAWSRRHHQETHTWQA